MRFETDRPELLSIVADIFSAGRPLMVPPADEPARLTLSAVSGPGMPGNAYSQVSVDGQLIYTARSEGVLVNYLETVVTDKLARHFTDYVLFHSGALASNGKGILLPGASGNGKSTTTTCLAMSGFTYYSDEMAICSPDGRRLFPFLKVPSLKTGGRQVVESAFHDAAKTVYRPPTESVTYFRPVSLPTDQEATNGVEIKYVLLPKRPENGETRLEPIKKSEALHVLVQESLDLVLRHTDGFQAIMAILESADCYTVQMADVHRGVELVRELTG